MIKKIYLADHLVLEDLFLVEYFNGEVLTSLDVASELDLGEIALPKGPTQLVLPDPGPAASRRPRRHLQSLSLFLPPLSLESSKSFLSNFPFQILIQRSLYLFFLQGCQTWDFVTLILPFYVLIQKNKNKALILWANQSPNRGSNWERRSL